MVATTCYLLVVSTRRMGKHEEFLGTTALLKSQPSEMVKDPDPYFVEFGPTRWTRP